MPALQRFPDVTPQNQDSPDNTDNMLTARSLARRYDISGRTLDRWLRNHVGFPPPDLEIHDATGRLSSRHWRIRTILEWESKQGRPKLGRPAKIATEEVA